MRAIFRASPKLTSADIEEPEPANAVIYLSELQAVEAILSHSRPGLNQWPERGHGKKQSN
jgi:hypothetical protein